MTKLAKCLLLAACVLGMQSGITYAANGCGPGKVYSSSLGQCIDKNAGAATKVFIPHGCPYNLDRVCWKTQGGLLVHCHCVS